MSAPANAEPWTPAQWDEMRAYFTSTTHPLRWQLRAQRLFTQIDRVRDEAEHYGRTREALTETALGIAHLAGQREGMEMAAGICKGKVRGLKAVGRFCGEPDAYDTACGDCAKAISERAAKIGKEETET